jgi:hypothetical protein
MLNEKIQKNSKNKNFLYSHKYLNEKVLNFIY